MPKLYSLILASTFFALLASPQALALSNNGALEHQPHYRHAASGHGVFKKRQGLVPTRGTTASQPSETTPAADPPQSQSSAATTRPAPDPPTSASSASSTPAQPSPSTTQGNGILDPIFSRSTTSASTPAQQTTTTPTTAPPTTQVQSQTQQQTQPPTSNQVQTTPPVQSGTGTRAPGQTTVRVTSSVTATTTATAEQQEDIKKTSQFGKNTIIAIAVIASCVGGAAAIWTLIRKWKLSPSSKFEDRMNPIEWTPPSNSEKDIGSSGLGAPGTSIVGDHRRANSTGSSRVSAKEQEPIGRNVTGNGNMFADQDPNQVVPPHDFTAGATMHNPYGYDTNAAGYADLHRGQDAQYGGQYDYNAGYGQYDYNAGYNQYDYNAGYADPNAHGQYDYNGNYVDLQRGNSTGASLARGPSVNRGGYDYAYPDPAQHPVPNYGATNDQYPAAK